MGLEFHILTWLLESYRNCLTEPDAVSSSCRWNTTGSSDGVYWCLWSLQPWRGGAGGGSGFRRGLVNFKDFKFQRLLSPDKQAPSQLWSKGSSNGPALTWALEYRSATNVTRRLSPARPSWGPKELLWWSFSACASLQTHCQHPPLWFITVVWQ